MAQVSPHPARRRCLVRPGLWEQAGVQAQVPTVAKATALGNTLLFQPDASVDSVVLLNTLSSVTDVAGFCSEVREGQK